MQSKEVLELMVEACDDKRAAEIKVYDVKETSPVTDYFVIATVIQNVRHKQSVTKSDQ